MYYIHIHIDIGCMVTNHSHYTVYLRVTSGCLFLTMRRISLYSNIVNEGYMLLQIPFHMFVHKNEVTCSCFNTAVLTQITPIHIYIHLYIHIYM